MAEKAAQSLPNSSPNPANSVEVDEEIKEGDTPEGAGGLSRELYKEMRVICDIISEHRLIVRGDE
jgi:hypothetical protein